MGRIFTIGEALIDFIPINKNCKLKEVEGFIKKAGGAPANVSVCASKLGSEAYFIGKVGSDSFGEYLIDSLKSFNVKSDFIFKTNKANTALAFVSLGQDGEREFSFYRNPSADLLLDKKDVENIDFNEDDLISFCSVDLVEYPVKYATIDVLDRAKKQNAQIIFDPNLRFNLWDDLDELYKTVFEFIKYADILKVSDEEIEFLTGTKNPLAAINYFSNLGVKNIIITLGKEGVVASINGNIYNVSGIKVNAVDTTGAGDSFVGATLHYLDRIGKRIKDLNEIEVRELLVYANRIAAMVTTKEGAMAAMPWQKELDM